jgi:predicted RND superfamily exporter protein
MIATVTIAGVVTTVMGVGVRGIMGWDLGIGESIAAVILIGLSVDYCVHLANAYCEAPASCDTRELRVQHALMTMGISITASAVTTIVSGSMLWLCILTFFSKFAFLITATIVSSFAWSLFFLPSALAAFGPPGRYSWSSLRPAQEWLVRKWQERRAK